MTVYKVVGSTPFRGHQPGDQFEADLTADEERRAKERGSIRVIKREPDKHKEEEKDA